MRTSGLIAAVVAVLALAFLTWRGRTGEAAGPPRAVGGTAASEAPTPRAHPTELRAPVGEEGVSRSAEGTVAEPAALERPGSSASLEDAGGGLARALGFVRRADGRAFPGVVVVAASSDERHAQVLTRTDARGVYELPLAAGRWRLTAVTHGFARTHEELRVEPGAEALDGPTLVLSEGSTIRGRVLDEHDQPVAGISVACADEEHGALQFFQGGELVEYGLHTVNSDAEGRFEFVGLEDASHALYPRLHLRPDLVAVTERLAGVRPGDERVVLRVRASRLLRGRVVHAVSGQPVRAFRVDGQAYEASDGRFQHRAADGGGLSVDAPGFLLWTCDALPPEGADGVVTIALEPDLHTARLVLRVVDPAGDELPHATVTGWADTGRRVEARGDGTLALEHLGAARYTLEVGARGYVSHELSLTLAPGDRATRTITLTPGFPLRVRAFDTLGEPLRNARIRVERPDGAPVGCAWTYDHAPRGATLWISRVPLPTEPDAWAELRHEVDGRLEGLPVGDYRLELLPPDDEPRSVQFTISAEGERELRIDL